MNSNVANFWKGVFCCLFVRGVYEDILYRMKIDNKIDFRFIYEASRLIEPSFDVSKDMYQLTLSLDRTVTSYWVGSLTSAANPVLIFTLKMPTSSNEHWALPLSNIHSFCPRRTLQQNDKRSWTSLVGRQQMSVLLALLWEVSQNWNKFLNNLFRNVLQHL